MKDADKVYKPEIKQKVLVDGVAVESADKGAKIKFIKKGFITSLQDDFKFTADQFISLFSPSNPKINELLVLIKNDNSAKIYSKFPLSARMRAKGDVKKGASLTREDIFDISTLEFRDSIYEIDIENDDKVIYLFRIGWEFGLFFDLTKKLKLSDLQEEIGHCYQRLFYRDLYSFIENKNYFTSLLADGWFPFIRLIGKNFDKIIRHYKEGKKHNFQIDDVMSTYTKEKIESFTKYWWRKKIFKDKKKILEAGISAFLQNDESGFINCINTLYPQIEGIMGLDYFKAHNKERFSHKELVTYIKQKATTKFNTLSTGFPSEFYEYLNLIFKDFDLKTGKLDLSRHTTSHGHARPDDFTKAKALQAILILDQIYFYL